MKKTFSVTTEFARKSLVEAINDLDITQPHNVKIEPLKRNRTAAQNGLYFHWVGCIANHIGDDKESMHGQLKSMFLLPIFCRDDEDFAALYAMVIDAVRCEAPNADKAIRSLKRETSITKASLDQMREYLDDISRMCAQQGIHLTVPDQFRWLGV